MELEQESTMSITQAVEYAQQQGLIITDRALRLAIAEGRLIATQHGAYYRTTKSAMDTFLLRRRRKQIR